MRKDSTQHPRPFVLLGSGPWLRQSPAAQRFFGLLFLLALGVLLVACIFGPQAFLIPETSTNLFFALFLGALVIAVLSLMGFVELLSHASTHQYCPDCLKYMTRGARVCPYCGLCEEQEPAAGTAAPPFRRPRRSA